MPYARTSRHQARARRESDGNAGRSQTQCLSAPWCRTSLGGNRELTTRRAYASRRWRTTLINAELMGLPIVRAPDHPGSGRFCHC